MHAGARPAAWLRARYSRVPIRMKLILAFAGVLTVLFGTVALLLYSLFSHELDDGIWASLRTLTSDLTAVVRQHHPQLPDPGPTTSGGVVQVIDANGHVLAFSPSSEGRPLLDALTLRRAGSGEVTVNDRDANLALLASPIAGSPPRVLVVGVSTADRDHTLATLRSLLFVGGPLALFLACLAGYVLAAQALAPVERMRGRAARIGDSGVSGASEARLPLPDAHDEIRRLAETLNEMLERIGEAVGRERALVTGASHELRTPLTIMLLELDDALASPERPRAELEETIRSVREEVRRLASLAEDLLVVARAEQGRLPIAKERIDVNGILRSLGERYGQLEGMVAGPVFVEEGPPTAIEADVGRLHQALRNMIDNALHHGGGRIVVRATASARAVELHVYDEGPGFPPDVLPRVFERFARAETEIPRGGLGLGLAIVSAVAAAHDGRAQAENRPGGGAHVWVTLPGAPLAPARPPVPSALG